MDCKDCRLLVEDYLSGSLNPSQRPAFEDHLASCPDCRNEQELMVRLDEALYTRPLKIPAVDFTQRTVARLRREEVPARDDAFLLHILAYVASFGALLVGVSRWSAQVKWASISRKVTEIFTEIVPERLPLSIDDLVLTFSTSPGMVLLEASALCILFTLIWILYLSFSD